MPCVLASGVFAIALILLAVELVLPETAADLGGQEFYFSVLFVNAPRGWCCAGTRA